jgi:hypothetical protein
MRFHRSRRAGWGQPVIARVMRSQAFVRSRRLGFRGGQAQLREPGDECYLARNGYAAQQIQGPVDRGVLKRFAI